MTKKQRSLPLKGLSLLSMICLLLFAIALIFQHGFDLQPCIKCIHQRLGVLLMAVIFFIATISPNWLRLTLYPLQYAIAIKTYLIAKDHAFKQHNLDLTSSCGFTLEMPPWFAIDKWLPEIFEVRGMCDQISWQFLGLTMPQWLSYILLGIIFLLTWVVINDTKIYRIFSRNIH